MVIERSAFASSSSSSAPLQSPGRFGVVPLSVVADLDVDIDDPVLRGRIFCFCFCFLITLVNATRCCVSSPGPDAIFCGDYPPSVVFLTVSVFPDPRPGLFAGYVISRVYELLFTRFVHFIQVSLMRFLPGGVFTFRLDLVWFSLISPSLQESNKDVRCWN